MVSVVVLLLGEAPFLHILLVFNVGKKFFPLLLIGILWKKSKNFLGSVEWGMGMHEDAFRFDSRMEIHK